MDWNRYLNFKKSQFGKRKTFWPENQKEAKQALALGVITISDYVEFSLTTEPVIDVIQDPDPVMRREGIRKLAQQRTAFSLHVLHQMLSDEEEEVRLYAAAEIDKIEKKYHERIHHFKTKLKSTPNEVPLLAELARTYIEYAEFLIKSPNLHSFFIQEAISLMQQVNRLEPHQPQHLFLLGRAYRMAGQYTEALSCFKQVVKLDKHFRRAYFAMAEIYFLSRRFDYVKQIMNVLSNKNEESEENDVQFFWKNEYSHN